MNNFMFEPRFHVGINTSHFRPPINPVRASFKVATKSFHGYLGSPEHIQIRGLLSS